MKALPIGAEPRNPGPGNRRFWRWRSSVVRSFGEAEIRRFEGRRKEKRSLEPLQGAPATWVVRIYAHGVQNASSGLSHAFLTPSSCELALTSFLQTHRQGPENAEISTKAGPGLSESEALFRREAAWSSFLGESP